MENTYKLDEDVEITLAMFHWLATGSHFPWFNQEVVKIPSFSEVLPGYSNEALKIVHFSTPAVKNDLDIRQWFEVLGITVLHIGFKYHNSKDFVVVDGPFFQALRRTIDDNTIEDVNPTKPTDRW